MQQTGFVSTRDGARWAQLLTIVGALMVRTGLTRLLDRTTIDERLSA